MVKLDQGDTITVKSGDGIACIEESELGLWTLNLSQTQTYYRLTGTSAGMDRGCQVKSCTEYIGRWR